MVVNKFMVEDVLVEVVKIVCIQMYQFLSAILFREVIALYKLFS